MQKERRYKLLMEPQRLQPRQPGAMPEADGRSHTRAKGGKSPLLMRHANLAATATLQLLVRKVGGSPSSSEILASEAELRDVPPVGWAWSKLLALP